MSAFPSEDELDARLAAARVSVMKSLPSRHSRRAVVIAASTTGAALLLTAGAMMVQRATQEEVSFSVQCYAQASTSGQMTTVAVPQAQSVDGKTTSREQADPVELCAAMWRTGLLGQSSRPADPNSANFPVPTLVACRLANDVGAAFPARGSNASLSPAEFCGQLSLTAW